MPPSNNKRKGVKVISEYRDISKSVDKKKKKETSHTICKLFIFLSVLMVLTLTFFFITNNSLEYVLKATPLKTSETFLLNSLLNPFSSPVSVKTNIYPNLTNNLTNYLSWIMPYKSHQTYGLVIEITKAEHLDKDRVFISDIYREINAKDDNWGEVINNSEYVRVTFEIPLNSSRDIAVYARSEGKSYLEVYTKGGTEIITIIQNISEENWYKTYLTNLKNATNTFDLRVVGDPVEFDYIVDPTTYNSVSVNSTIAGKSALFSVNVNDETALHPNGQYIFSTNNSGIWINYSEFGGGPSLWNDSTINAGIDFGSGDPGDIGTNAAVTVFQKDGIWYMISGNGDGVFYGYFYNGTQWLSNSTINASLPDIGTNSNPTVFQKDGVWYLISGEDAGVFYGFDWNGTGWEPNSTINASLPDIGSRAAPFVFHKDSSWYLISGEYAGKLKGFVWDSGQWVANTTINKSLPDTGYYSSPVVFQKENDWYLITSDFGSNTFKGYTYNGTDWESNSTILSGISGLNVAIVNADVFRKDGLLYFLGGHSGGYFPYSYQWVDYYNFTSTPQSVNKTIILNSSVGTIVGYKWYFTDNTGDMNNTGIRTLVTSSSTDPISTLGTNPVNAYNSSSSSVTFDFKASDDTGIDYIQLWGNWSGGWHANYTNTSYTNDTWLNKTVLGIVDGYYLWGVYSNDSVGNSNWSANRTLTVDTTAPYFTALENQTSDLSVSFFYDINALDDGVGLDGFHINDTSVFKINYTTGVVTNTTTLSEAFYTFNITVNDTNAHLNWSFWTVNITNLDTINPKITLVYPDDTHNFSTSSVEFSALVNDNINLTNVTLFGNFSGNWGGNESNVSGLNNTQYNFTLGLLDGYYVWGYYAEDNSSNSVFSENRTLTVDTIAPYFTVLENQTGYNTSSLSYDIDAADEGVGIESYFIDDTTNFSIDSATGVITNATTLIEYYYIVNVSVNDTLGHLNWSLWSYNVSSLNATTYYVSNSTGSDANNGTDTEHPWKTIAHVNAQTFNPGDKILFKRGDIWRETLIVPSNGTSSNYITFGNYGTGNNPQILGSNISSGWTSEGGNVYSSDTTFIDPRSLYPYYADITFNLTNGTMVWGTYVSDTASLVSDYDWTWNSGDSKVYVYSSAGDPDSIFSSIEVPQRRAAIETKNNQYLHFNGIDVFFSAEMGYDTYSAHTDHLNLSGLILENSKISHIGGISTGTNQVGYGIALIYSNMVLKNNTISNCGRRGISLDIYGSGFTVTNVIIENNTFYGGYHTTGVDLSVGSGSYTGSYDGVVIRRNLFYEPFDPGYSSNQIFLQNYDYAGGGATTNNISIYNNIFENTSGTSIMLEGVENITINNNDFYEGLVVSPYTIQLWIDSNNVNITIKNNIFYSTQSDKFGWPIYSITNYAQIDLDNNLYYRVNNSVRIISYYGTLYYMNDQANLVSNYGWEINGVFANPKFVDNETNFSLQSTSPAIDNGTDIVGYNTDYFWVVVGSPPNIGAFETSYDLSGIDSTNPEITLVYPDDTHNFSTLSVEFSALVSDNINLTNVTLFGNFSGSWAANETNFSGINNTQYNFTLELTDGYYIWEIFANDSSDNPTWSTNRTFTIDTTAPYFTDLVNQTSLVNQSFSYDVNASDNGVGLASFSLNDTSNFTINFLTGVITNVTSLTEVYFYTLNLSVNDSLGNLNWSVFTINITSDSIPPQIAINSPTPGQIFTSSTVSFSIRTNEESICNYTLNSGTNNTLTANSTNTGFTDSQILSNADYTALFYCKDLNGNLNNTQSVSFSVNVPDSTSTSSSGGGGGSITNETTDENASQTNIEEFFELFVINSYEKIVRINDFIEDEIKIKNGCDCEKKVNVSIKSLEDVLAINQNNFTLSSREETTIPLTINASNKTGVYEGKIILVSDNFKKEIPVKILVISGNSSISAKLRIPFFKDIIKSNSSLSVYVSLEGVGLKEENISSVIVNYIVRDLDGNVYLKESEMVMLEGKKSYKKYFNLEGFPEGEYTVEVEIEYLGKLSSVSLPFKIKKGIGVWTKEIFWGSLLLLIILVCVILFFISRKK